MIFLRIYLLLVVTVLVCGNHDIDQGPCPSVAMETRRIMYNAYIILLINHLMLVNFEDS